MVLSPALQRWESSQKRHPEPCRGGAKRRFCLGNYVHTIALMEPLDLCVDVDGIC